MARGFTNSEAKDLIERSSALLEEFNAAAQLSGTRHTELAQIVRETRSRKVDARFSDVVIRQAGENTYEVLDINPLGAITLDQLNGIENPSLVQITDGLETHTLAECQQRAFEGTRINLDGRHDAAANAVLHAAFVSANSYQPAAICKHAADAYGPHVQALVEKIEAGSGTFKWLLASRDKKDEAERSYLELKALIDQCLDPTASTALDTLNSLPNISEDAAWAWFSSNREDALREVGTVSASVVGTDDWQFLSSDAKKLSGEVSGYGARLSEKSDASPASLESIIRRAVSKSFAGDVLGTLKTVPIEELARTGRGIRVKSLRDAGFEAIADVYAATKTELESVHGISYSGACDIKKAATEFANEVEKGLKLRLSADNKTPEATRILCVASALKEWRELSHECGTLLDAVTKETSTPLAELSVARRPMAWLFSTPEEREKATGAYNSLNAFLVSETALKANATLKRMYKLEQNAVPADRAWVEFTANPVAIINILEDVVPEALGNDDTLFGLPEELAREIQDEAFFPEGLNCTLRRYQEWGVKYILHQGKTLLGDEMGLGKTVQAIAAMVSLKNVGESRFLVVCPASVLENWCREVKKHSKLRVTKVHGRNCRTAFEDWTRTGGVAVTTYETTRKLKLAEGSTYGLAVVDEAHYIKNPEAARSKNTLRLLENANRVLLMTGTALENKVDEMLTLIGYLRPDVARRARPLAFMSGAQRFRDEVAPVYYRRKREDVLTELPELIESEEWCTLGEVEKEAYERAVLRRSIMASRQVSWNVANLEEDSSKAKRLLEIIDSAADDGRKVLVFTFFLNTAYGIANLLGDKCVGLINGSVPPARRQEIVEEFDASEPGSVLVAQIQSGGTGMNIQCASVVVFCEPQYKPSIENQAVSRAYRMGQTRSVLAFRLLCENTVDEHILEIIRSKQQIFDAFADKSSAAAAAAEQDIAVDDKGMGKIIEEEIERIKAENPGLAAQVEREMEEARELGLDIDGEGAASAGAHAEGVAYVPASRPRRAMGVTRQASTRPASRPKPAVDTLPAASVGTHEGGTPRPSSAIRPAAVKMAPRFCPNCGNAFSPGTKFCCYCGAKLPSPAP